MALINVGTRENPRWIEESLVWGNTSQKPEDRAAEHLATGSTTGEKGNMPKVVLKHLDDPKP